MIIKNSIFLFAFLFAFELFSEGFAAGTKIKTDHNYKPIEHMFKGRKVTCRLLKKYQSRTDKVFYTYKTGVPKFAYLEFAQYEIKCALDQQFYIRVTKEWVTAHQIICNTHIQRLFTQQTRLRFAKIIEEPIDLYIFTTKKYHNFLVSFDDILAHNLEPLFAASGIASVSLPALAEGGATFLSSGNLYIMVLGIVAAGSILLYNWITADDRKKEEARELQNLLDEQRQKQLRQEQKEAIATTGSPGPQRDPDNKSPKKMKITVRRFILMENMKMQVIIITIVMVEKVPLLLMVKRRLIIQLK